MPSCSGRATPPFRQEIWRPSSHSSLTTSSGTSPAINQLSGQYDGVDATIGSFLKNFEETNGTFRVELHDVLGSDEHAVALATVSGERDGKSLSDRYVHVVHVKDGKVSESWLFEDDQDAVDAFWG